MKTVRIKLTPLGSFFFGRNKTFSKQDGNKYGDQKQIYFAKSAHFPQQTAVVGMLRFLIAEAKNFQETDKWIGSGAFDIERESNFGLLKEISEVFILKDGEKLFLQGKDSQSYSKLSMLLSNNQSPLLDGYSPKEPFALTFSNGQSIDDVFQVCHKTGIQLSISRTTNDEGYFKQDSYLFKRDHGSYTQRFAFGVDVSFDESFDPSVLDGKVGTLGGDSQFRIAVMERTLEVTESNENAEKIVLQSDTFVEKMEELKKVTKFILTDFQEPFKFIRSRENGFYSKPQKSNQFFLLPRGTTIFFDQEKKDKVINLINNRNFTKIGMNKYI